MGIPVRCGLFRSTGVLGLAVAVVLGIAGSAGPASATTNITVGLGVVVLSLGARAPLGFQFGPVDGVMGGVKESPNHYRFFGSGESLKTTACPGTPGVQGVYAFTADLSTSPPGFTTDCKALLQPSGPLVETGIVGSYDQNYVGGGPTMRVTHPDGRRGVLLVYHAEIQWYDDGPCAAGTTLCFYGTLGMAFSADDGATFQKLGLIIQSHISRATFHTPPYLGGNVPIGNGPFVLGDAAGNAVDPRTADPTQTYVYVFYVDNQEDLGSLDPCAPGKACLAVARAPLSQVIQAAFAGAGVTGLFQKYYNGGFTEPAAPPDPNGTLPTNNAGRYTPVLKGAFSPSAVYDAATRQVILASVTAGQIQLRVSQKLLDWSQPPVATLSEAAPFAEVRYPSLIGELDDANVAGGQPWLFYSQEPPSGTWPQTEFMVARLQVSGPQLSLTASVNQSTFAVGEVLTTSASLDNPGLPGAADLYLGALRPDRVSIVFYTGPGGIALGSLGDLRSFRPYTTAISLTTSFPTNMPNFLSHTWTGTEPRGNYVFFHLAVQAGALAGGAPTSDQILGLTTAPFAFQ